MYVSRREPVIPDPTNAKTSSSIRLHYLALLEEKIGALDQAAPLVGWDLPAEFATLRRLLEARMGKPGKREFVHFEVVRFVEKPPLEAARRMVASGKFLWNAGMFVMDVATLASELEQHAPDLARAMREFAGAPAATVARIYRRLDFDAFDRVVAEKSRNVLSVQARFRWHDVGSWEGLWEALGGRESNVLKGEVIALDCEGVLARGGEGRLMVLLGVKDLVAVDTGDALLIAGRKSSQDLRRVVDQLARRRLDRYL